MQPFRLTLKDPNFFTSRELTPSEAALLDKFLRLGEYLDVLIDPVAGTATLIEPAPYVVPEA
jgi:hypothetical protein